MRAFLDLVNEVEPKVREYRGWALRWTGYKIGREDIMPVGQWVARRDDAPNFYASSPGLEGQYRDGEIFAIGGGKWSILLTKWTGDERNVILLLQARLDALERCRWEIDKYLHEKREKEMAVEEESTHGGKS